MDRARRILTELGGIAPARDLRAAGLSVGELRAAVLAHDILRFRKGWYAVVELPRDVVLASRVGGVLACASAAKHLGLWVLDADRLHVAVGAHSSRLRHPDDHHHRLATDKDAAIIHWDATRAAPYELVESIPEALRHIFDCQGPTACFVAWESALRKGRLNRGEQQGLQASIPAWGRPLFDQVGALSDSGTETLVKLALIEAGIAFQQQVLVPQVGFLDFLIGDSLVIEVDSKEFHSNPTRDRERDAELSRRGYRVLRFMYSQVVHGLAGVMAAIQAAIRRGDHR